MTTTPLPMPEPCDLETLAAIANKGYTTQDMKERDAQWMERIAAERRLRAVTDDAYAKARERITALEAALKKVNDQAEHFEREWYLRGDAIEEMREALQELLNDTQHAEHPNCDDGPCPVRAARTALENTHD